VITVIEHPTAERKASFVQKREAWIQEKRERNRQIENQAIQAAQNTAFEGPASTTPGNDTAGITEIPRAKEPTKKEIEEMNARGIIIY
jgi:hypothetical protein